MSESLAESHQLQQQLVWRQEESLEYHKELANGIIGAKSNVMEMLEEFKVSTVEQKTLIFEVFDRVARLQNLVVSEVSWLYTVRFLAFSNLKFTWFHFLNSPSIGHLLLCLSAGDLPCHSDQANSRRASLAVCHSDRQLCR